MTSQQTKLCEMMQEFHALCHAHQAEYYLIGHQLLHAAKDGKIHGYEMDIAMFMEDWERIRSQSEKLPDIEIESPEDRGLLPGCYYRWVDKTTLLLDLDRVHVIKKPAIGINIHIIRKAVRDPYLAMYEKEMRRLSEEKSKMKKPWLSDRAFLVAARLAEKRLKSSAASKDEEKTMIRARNGKRIFLSGDVWKHKSEVYLDRLAFDTMRDYSAYLVERYGKKWKKVTADCAKESYRCIFSTEVSYTAFMQEAVKKNLLDEAFVSASKQYQDHYRVHEEHLKREKDGWDKTLFAVGERYRLWKKYMPLKQQISELIESDRIDEAELLLQDYMNVLEKYLKKKIVITFDRETLDYARIIYSLNGQESILKQIDKYLRESDLEPIQLTW